MGRPSPIDERSVEDARLVARLSDRDGSALEALFDRYSRIVYALARRVTGAEDFAQDVVQDVFLTLWRDAGRYRPDRGTVSTYLLALTHHRAVDAVRREERLRRQRTRLADDLMSTVLTDAPPSVPEQAWSRMRRREIREALQELPDGQREVLTLAYFGGYTQREVATLTGAPLGTIKTRMLTGLRRLRERLGERSVDSGDFADSGEEGGR